ncbi:MAG TPA: hemerythrin domain-containing protein [Polyangiaceae bacterium]|jgi:hemerythrin-like domain-containing protein
MPLHRHPALVPLSKDHHAALQLALALRLDGSEHLRRRLPQPTSALVAHVRRVFIEELEPHFRTEELELMVVVDGLDQELDALCANLRREHARMRLLIRALAQTYIEAEQLALLDQFGRLLEAHIRAEERALFTRVQELLGGGTLAKIAPRLAARPGLVFPERAI